MSAFGSGTNENQFLIDGTNTICPCNGIARAEIGVDFMQEVRVQSVGASAEFGNMQGAVINVVTRQGGDRFLYDASYYSQMPDLTSQPVMVPLAPPSSGMTGYERARYRDFTTNLGGPVLRNRLWFFTGYRRPDDAAGDLWPVRPERSDGRAEPIPLRRHADHDDRLRHGTGGHTRQIRTVDARNLVPDPDTHPPHTDEYAAGVDREIGRRIAVAIAYVHKRGRDFIGWTDIGGQYREEARTLPDGRSITVYQLVNSTADQRFLLTNPEGYALSYNGLVIAVDKRQADGWQAFASYTYSRTTGLQASSGETAAGAQASTVAMPTRTFGRDPNDLTNAWGRLPNDRPHIFRPMGTLDVPRTGIVIAVNLQQFSGKPWGATTQVRLRQGNQRIALEPRGTRRLESQTLLDLRVSRAFRFGAAARIELLMDALNLLNETAGEGLVSDDLYSPTFGQPTLFVDPRRVMSA